MQAQSELLRWITVPTDPLRILKEASPKQMSHAQAALRMHAVYCIQRQGFPLVILSPLAKSPVSASRVCCILPGRTRQLREPGSYNFTSGNLTCILSEPLGCFSSAGIGR